MSFPDRASIRLRHHDYSRAGFYFVTLCAFKRRCSFGKVESDGVVSTDLGKIVERCWFSIPEHFSAIELDQFVLMPNHLHGILVIKPGPGGEACLAPTKDGKGPVLGQVVGSFKSAVSKQAHRLGEGTVWQRNYYEHVIRGEAELHGIRLYISNNPIQWALDKENPDRRPSPSTGWGPKS